MALSLIQEIYCEHGVFGANAGRFQKYRNNDGLNRQRVGIVALGYLPGTRV